MQNKPYADDWQTLDTDLEYSDSRKLYYYKGQVYDELSAHHNGIIGHGAQLRKIISAYSKQ